MSNTSTEDLNLLNSWVRTLDTSDLIELWENLTQEVNSPSVIWNMDFFLEEYLPECVNAKTLDVLDLARIVTGKDGLVKHFDINDDYVYTNSLGLWESINEYDIENLVIDFISGYDCIEHSNTIKEKLAELKEDVDQEDADQEDADQEDVDQEEPIENNNSK